METKTDGSLCRVPYTNLLDIETNKSIVIPGFNAFCASILPSAKTNDVGYFPLITSSPTNAGVVKTAMQTLVNAVKAVNMKNMKTIFSDKCDYYQTLTAPILLYKIMS